MTFQSVSEIDLIVSKRCISLFGPETILSRRKRIESALIENKTMNQSSYGQKDTYCPKPAGEKYIYVHIIIKIKMQAAKTLSLIHI